MQGLFTSHHTNSNDVDSIFHGSFQSGSEAFPGFDAAAQAELGIVEMQCEEPVDRSVFSGVSDNSIMLGNSNLWVGDISQVNLSQLKMENNFLTKVSRCEYFRHNSSRLVSLEESVAESDRPGLGVVHYIRSPGRRPCSAIRICVWKS